MSFGRTIEMELSSQSIEKAIVELKRFRKDLEDACKDLVRVLMENGITVAKMNVMGMNAVDTGALEESIQGVFFPEERIGVVFTDVPYALFVEYGTGIVGQGSPHQEPGKVGWEYDVNGHGESGWVYYSNVDGRGRFRWTKGMPSRPYMYNTLRWLEQNAAGLAREVFAQV